MFLVALLSLRQSSHAGHSFSAPCGRPERRRIGAFPAILPNHARRPTGPFRALFLSLGPLSLTQPNHGRFGTDVRSQSIQLVRLGQNGLGFERRPLRRGKLGSERFGSVRPHCAELPGTRARKVSRAASSTSVDLLPRRPSLLIMRGVLGVDSRDWGAVRAGGRRSRPRAPDGRPRRGGGLSPPAGGYGPSAGAQGCSRAARLRSGAAPGPGL
jgi:hypothetical protein